MIGLIIICIIVIIFAIIITSILKIEVWAGFVIAIVSLALIIGAFELYRHEEKKARKENGEEVFRKNYGDNTQFLKKLFNTRIYSIGSNMIGYIYLQKEESFGSFYANYSNNFSLKIVGGYSERIERDQAVKSAGLASLMGMGYIDFGPSGQVNCIVHLGIILNGKYEIPLCDGELDIDDNTVYEIESSLEYIRQLNSSMS